MPEDCTTAAEPKALRDPTLRGLRWGLVSTVAGGAIIGLVDHMVGGHLWQRPHAALWGSLGLGVLGYSLGADLTRARNRTATLAQTYECLERNGMLVPTALPQHSERLRHKQGMAKEVFQATAVQGIGGAALAMGVEALLALEQRPLQRVATEWGVIGAGEGFVSAILQTREHNRRAVLIERYETKAAEHGARI